MPERRLPRSVGEEIRMSFRSRGHEAVVALLRTADDVRRYYGEVLREEGVTLQQYNVLRILRRAGRQGLPTLDIAHRMVERTPGVTRIVDRLEAKGWVKRTRGKKDRRQVFCALTPRGAELLDRLEEPILEAERQLLCGLEDREVTPLVDLLDSLRAALPLGQDGVPDG